MTDTDFDDLKNQCVTDLYNCIENVSKYIDDSDIELNTIKSYIKSYCIMDSQQKVASQALDNAKGQTDVSDIHKMHDAFWNHLNTLADSNLNVETHPYMLEFNKRTAQPRQRVCANLDESDIAITESQMQLIDPITKKQIENPVKNRICGHVYEKKAILNLLQLKQKTKCPVVGCGNRNPILKGDLVNDEELRFRLALTQHSTMIQEDPVFNISL